MKASRPNSAGVGWNAYTGVSTTLTIAIATYPDPYTTVCFTTSRRGRWSCCSLRSAIEPTSAWNQRKKGRIEICHADHFGRSVCSSGDEFDVVLGGLGPCPRRQHGLAVVGDVAGHQP